MKKILLISLMVSGVLWAAEGDLVKVELNAAKAAQVRANSATPYLPYMVTENNENLIHALSGKAYAGQHPKYPRIELYRHEPINENEVQSLLASGAKAEQSIGFRPLLKNGTLAERPIGGNLLDMVASRVTAGDAPNAAVIRALIAHGAKPTNFALLSLLDSSAESSIPAFDALFSSGKDTAFINNPLTKETMQDAKNSLTRLKTIQKSMGSKFSAEDAERLIALEEKLRIYNSYNSVYSRFMGVVKSPAQ